MPKPKMKSGLAIRTDPPLDQLAARFKVAGQRNIGQGIGTVAGRVSSHLKKVTPRRTGRLVQSQRLKRRNDLEWELTENVKPPYGLFIRRGVPANKINPIVPVRKKALFWEGARHPVKIVRNHPGIKPNDYFAKAIKAAEPDIKRESEKIGRDIVADLIE